MSIVNHPIICLFLDNSIECIRVLCIVSEWVYARASKRSMLFEQADTYFSCFIKGVYVWNMVMTTSNSM